MSKIRITNPQPGSAQYCTESRAERYIRRGEAVLFGQELTFLSPIDVRKNRAATLVMLQEQRARVRSDAYVDPRGVIFWNGCEVMAMHRPGEVVS